MDRNDLTQLSSLINKFGFGFDGIFNDFNRIIFDSKLNSNFPHYDIQICHVPEDKNNDEHTDYVLTMALAGFKRDQIEVFASGKMLTIRSKLNENPTKDTPDDYYYRGISRKQFEKKFSLAPETEVVSAKLEDGLLSIILRKNENNTKTKLIEIK